MGPLHMVWGLGLHRSCKFLSHLRKPKLARRSLVPFLRNKALIYFPQFYLTNSIMAVKLRKSIRSASYLTAQKRPFSPLQWSDLGIFQLSPSYSSLVFSQLSPPTQYLSTGWVIPLASFSQPPTQYLSYWEGAGNLLHHQIKLRISTNMGDVRTRRDLTKFICTPRGGGWAQGATAGTRAPVPCGVQLKEGSPLWVTSSVTIAVG